MDGRIILQRNDIAVSELFSFSSTIDLFIPYE